MTAPMTREELLADELRAFCAAAPHDYPGHNIDLFQRCETALRNSAPQETRGDEPVAWTIPGDDTADCNGFIPTKVYQEGEFTKPLYAAPQQSLRLEREGLARCLVNNDPNYSIYHMPGDAPRKVKFTSGWIGITHELSADEAERVRVRADAILALLSPDTTVVPSTSRREVHVPGVVSNLEPIDHSGEECPNFPGCHCANHCCDGWMHPCPEDGPVPSKDRGAE